MPHSFGLRSKTRHLFAKKFGEHGTIPTQRFLKSYYVGQIVDIHGDGAQHKGMPHKYYHGKTGVVWNVTKRAIGVEVNKLVGGRIIKKRIHVRIEHVKHSKCKQDFLARVAKNEKLKREAKAAGKKVPKSELKRAMVLPASRGTISGRAVTTLAPLPFHQLYT